MNLVRMKGITPVQDGPAKSYMETMILTPEGVRGWKKPPFQRPLRINDKILALVQELKTQQGVLPGVLTLGVLDRERYIVDGQHRAEAFLMSELKEGIADVRVIHFDSMGEMGDEFVKLNSRLVTMRPDDILRAMEPMHDGLRALRKRCPFIGYGYVRRGGAAAVDKVMLSMSLAVRTWFSTAPEVPSMSLPVADCAKQLTTDEAKYAAAFYERCWAAWMGDLEYGRLWTALNLTMCAWLWRRLVVTQYSAVTTRVTSELFEKCLRALSADPSYIDFLLGRHLNERERSPTFQRVKSIFAKRIHAETGKAPRLPQPAWAPGHGKKFT